MTVEPISPKQPSTPLKTAAVGAGVAAAATAGFVAGNKTDTFHKIGKKITSEGKVQNFAKKALNFVKNIAKKVTPKVGSAFNAVKNIAKGAWGKVATVADRVIKFVSGSLDKLEAKINPKKFGEVIAKVAKK